MIELVCWLADSVDCLRHRSSHGEWLVPGAAELVKCS